MYYLDRVQKAIDFIETNLTEKINIDLIASEACLSVYHFHRIFQTMVGDSVMGYVRKRRLSAAANVLTKSSRRIIDIAFEYQFESQEAFTRAFKKLYGITPGRCRENRDDIILYEKKSLTEGGVKFKDEGMVMEPKISDIGPIKVIGPKIRTTMENDQAKMQIPAFWDKFVKQQGWKKIPNMVEERDRSYGICTDHGPTDEFSYMFGFEVISLDSIPAGMTGLIIPAGKYAVFTSKGRLPETLQKLWAYIYGEWLPKSGYERADTEDFEVYEKARLMLAEPEVDIYIPLK